MVYVIYKVIRCLLLDPNPESALNEEAGRLLQEDYNEYVARARLYTDVHACHHLRNLKAVKVTHESDSHGILRDTNAPSSKKTAGKPAVQRHISATKKALKRL
ncbi:Ubiquitin-conjugating enzyme E2 S [Fasciola hepatica]|uniref:Ubiquitin-conjugating enzyme E2 S n=1 Tax=Fasciola hepatica TaxID=6192 RepID=A0A4E0R2A8_FASHE|nr:Ubiquitin-conjugating enzyme E2 S [Fasciola hepatica]